MQKQIFKCKWSIDLGSWHCNFESDSLTDAMAHVKENPKHDVILTTEDN